MLGKKRSSQKKITKTESFLSKLHDILSDNTYNEIIHWDTDGKRIIICDVINLCNVVLPKFYKHHNYSSFVRQLNMYGFHKSKGIIKNGEGYEHEKFCKNSTKEEISQIIRQSKKMKVLVNYIKSNQKEDSKNDNDFLENGNEDDVLKYLFEKNEENLQNSLALKNEIENLRKENTQLTEEIALFKSVLNSHKLLLEKILKKSNENEIIIKKNPKRVKNLNDLFNKYLYFLRIYSPYVNIENNNFFKQKTIKDEKDEPEKNKENEKNEKNENNNIDSIKNNIYNNDSLNDELILNNTIDFPFPDLSLPNNFSSRSFSRFFK
jgi:hypothetical protein